jgi:ribosomal protein S27AE
MIVAYDGDSKAKCLFCEHEEDGETLAQYYVEEILNISQYECVTQGGEYPLYTCEECGQESLVMDEDRWACFSCGYQWDTEDISFCDTCGTVYVLGKHDVGMCDSCIDHRMNRD